MIAFFLTMPGVGFWNGKWSGSGNLYAKVCSFSRKKEQELDGKTFHYSWPDGWRAMIRCAIVKGAEPRRIRKETKGFYGYDWMIDSIRYRGKILGDHEVTDEEKELAERYE